MANLLRLSACLFVLLSFSMFSNASSLISYGDGSRTLDTTTGKLWLDLSLTTNRSYNDISSLFGDGQEFSGYRYATTSEVLELWGNAGIISELTADPSDCSFTGCIYNGEIWGANHSTIVTNFTTLFGGPFNGSAMYGITGTEITHNNDGANYTADIRFSEGLYGKNTSAFIFSGLRRDIAAGNYGSYLVSTQSIDYVSIITGDTSGLVEQAGFIVGTIQATDINGLTDGSYFTLTTPPNHGQAIINSSTGLWTYIASASYFGLDPFTITVTDDLGGTTQQVISIEVLAPDADNDNINDQQDNCPNTPNQNQEDLDEDGTGDACDNDADGDGFTSDHDYNDLNVYLSTDPDNDGVDSSGTSHYSDNVCLRSPQCNENDPCITVCYVPPQDNCPTLANPDQSNIDGDANGDACDIDIDGDSIRNSIETAAGMNPNDPSDGDQAELSALEALGINKQVPAMGGIGLLALGLSMLGLGAVRLRK